MITALIIEDNKDTADLLASTMQRVNIEYKISNFGEDAIKLLAKNNYDLVLLDLVLPDISGNNILKFLQKNNEKQVIIIISAIGDIENKIAGINLQADDYLAKPFMPNELISRIFANVRRKIYDNTTNFIWLSDDISYDIKNLRLEKDAKVIALAKDEIEIIDKVARNRNNSVYIENSELLIANINNKLGEELFILSKENYLSLKK